MEINEGLIIGKYKFQCSLGKGNFGVVWKALHIETQEIVAIKMVNKAIFIDHPKFESYLLAETKYLPLIKHENVVRLIEFFEDKSTLYFVIEYCNFGDLGIYLKSKLRIPEQEALGYLKQLISAFQILNSHKIMHRDLKLENILLTKIGNDEKIIIKLCDFDFLKKGEIGSTYLGTCLYMAPEILKYNKYYTNKTDLWSLGVVLYKILYGNYPFRGKTESNLIQNIENMQVKYPEEYEISEFSVKLMKDIFQIDPEKRISWEKVYELFDLPAIPLFNSNIKEEKKDDNEKEQENEGNHYRNANVKQGILIEGPMKLKKEEYRKNEKIEEKGSSCLWFRRWFR